MEYVSLFGYEVPLQIIHLVFFIVMILVAGSLKYEQKRYGLKFLPNGARASSVALLLFLLGTGGACGWLVLLYLGHRAELSYAIAVFFVLVVLEFRLRMQRRAPALS